MAKKAIAQLEKEGSAVAFMEVFQLVQTDMQSVAKRLDKSDTGAETVALEDDLIATLEDMIDAVTKKR
jgi:hypothetical protein